MIATWFVILSVMIAVFAVMEGWDFGVGVLHYVVARNQEERRVLIASLGPLWSWGEVWLVGIGGVLFVAFPKVLAIAFPAYYLALFMVLWALLLRGISLEFRGHLEHPMWRSFCDVVFFGSNAALAVLFGVAIGNIVRGMPLKPDEPINLPLFTDFGVHGNVGVLDWYTLSVAAFTLVCLAAHGASYLSVKTDGEVHRRSTGLAAKLWIATGALLALVTAGTMEVRPELVAGLASRPAAWLAIAIVAAGAVGIATGFLARSELRTFAGGCAVIAGLMGGAAASLFPVMIHSTVMADYSITAFNGSSDLNNLTVAAYWWPVAFVLALVYFGFIAKYYRGRVQLSKDTQHPY